MVVSLIIIEFSYLSLKSLHLECARLLLLLPKPFVRHCRRRRRHSRYWNKSKQKKVWLQSGSLVFRIHNINKIYFLSMYFVGQKGINHKLQKFRLCVRGCPFSMSPKCFARLRFVYYFIILFIPIRVENADHVFRRTKDCDHI